jgi:hypothetical protein
MVILKSGNDAMKTLVKPPYHPAINKIIFKEKK